MADSTTVSTTVPQKGIPEKVESTVQLTPPSPPATSDPLYYSAGSSESQYQLRFSYSDYDLYRSVVEITLNVSFLAATSNQLRLLISFRETEHFVVSTVLVTAALILQLLIAINVVTIAMNDQFRWMKLKAFTSIGAILLTVVSILIPFVMNAEHSTVDFLEIKSH
ncbi:uncharacterized protein LOC6036180 isoform X2 [Culex quinquefasciatus]|nr:uncharacterized protein LOC6036180 isoform X2 [Culex quinquefasciatus]XP_038113694.1 uncharacterized protein LOC6036180 isoform X2 [Culex quinquefasciatus]